MLNYNLNILGAASRQIVPIGATPTTTTTTTTTTTSTTTTTTTAGTGIVQNGIVLWLDATEVTSYPGSGSTWYDLSPTGRNATGINITGSYTSSVSGGFFNLTSTGSLASLQYFTVAHTSSFDVFNGDYSIDVWFLNSMTGSAVQGQDFAGLFSKPVFNSASLGGVNLMVNRSNTSTGSTGDSTRTFLWQGLLVASSSVSGGYQALDEWTNLQLVRSGSTTTLYTNLTSSMTTGSLINMNTTQSISIGRGLDGTFGYELAVGKLAFVALYNRALTAADRQQNHNTISPKL